LSLAAVKLTLDEGVATVDFIIPESCWIALLTPCSTNCCVSESIAPPIEVEILVESVADVSCKICVAPSIDNVSISSERVLLVVAVCVDRSVESDSLTPGTTDVLAGVTTEESSPSDRIVPSVAAKLIVFCKFVSDTLSAEAAVDSETGVCDSEKEMVAVSTEESFSFERTGDTTTGTISLSIIDSDALSPTVTVFANCVSNELSVDVVRDGVCAIVAPIGNCWPKVLLLVVSVVVNRSVTDITICPASVTRLALIPLLDVDVESLIKPIVVDKALLSPIEISASDPVKTAVSTDEDVSIVEPVIDIVSVIELFSAENVESTTEKIFVSTLVIFAESVIVLVSVELVVTVPERIDCGESIEIVIASVSIIALFVLSFILLSVELLTTLLGEELVLELVTIDDSVFCENSSESAN